MTNHAQDTGQTKSKSHFEPRSVQEWEQFLANDTRGAFMTYRDMYRSGAFRELRKHPKQVLVFIEALSQLNFEKTDKRAGRQSKKQGEKRNKTSRVYKNGGIVYLTQHRLEAIGIGVTTQVAAKKALVKLGFLDAVVASVTGNYGQFNPSVYQVSERWRKYPDVPPQEDGIQINGCVYPEYSLSDPNHPIHIKRRKTKQKPIQKVNAKSIQKVNARGTSAHSITECKDVPLHAKPRSTTECILKDFHTVQDDSIVERSDGPPPTTDTHLLHSTAPQGGPPKHQRSNLIETDGGVFSPIDPKILKTGMPAKVAIILVSRGHSCTLAQKRPHNETQLDFSNGVTVHVRPREYELVGSNGAYRKRFHDLDDLQKHLDELDKLLPRSTPSADVPPTPLAIRVEEIMFTCGYGLCVQAKEEYGEHHLTFAENVNVWIMPGSIKVERPGRRRLTVKDPEELTRKLVSENRNSAHDMPRQSSGNSRF